MRKAYDWKTGTVFKIDEDFARFIWEWDVERSTDPLTWGNFFSEEDKEELDFCFIEGVEEYWWDAFTTIKNNKSKIDSISDEEYLDMELDQIVNFLKKG